MEVDDEYRDAFGFTGPLPLSSNQRRIPEPGFPTGPAVGEPLQDFSLSDHTGRRMAFHADRGDAGAVLVFIRSVVWSPSCLTQLGELQDALPDFRAAGVKVYALSYDDREALAEFAAVRGIGFPLLTDPSSAVIWRYRLLNTLLAPSDVPFYGVPYPGSFLVDEAGVVKAKFFYRHMARRVSAETMLDVATGTTPIGEGEPCATGGGDGIRITVLVRGGQGVLKSGPVRRLVARFELDEGLSLCAAPAAPGLRAARIEVVGPKGLRVEEPIPPPTEPLLLDERGAETACWRGAVDLVSPLWADSDLVCVTAPPRRESVDLDVTLHYQVCEGGRPREPRSETFTLALPVGVHDVPNLPGIGTSGHRIVAMESARHFQRLIRRARSESEA